MTSLLWVCEAHCLPRVAWAAVLQVRMQRGPECRGAGAREARSSRRCLWHKACTEHIPAHQSGIAHGGLWPPPLSLGPPVLPSPH